jgi:hypothetical protein
MKTMEIGNTHHEDVAGAVFDHPSSPEKLSEIPKLTMDVAT